ncbi:MAG: c-type cytochrome [Halieaceae bacterium]|jgi:mono/diheme cytochrome c family protein|nr:c-type cytochrome [Halieaceae bacterium]
MANFLKVMLFSAITIGLFAGYSNFGIPQIKPAPPPQPEVLDLSSMTMDQYIALGERIYNGQGTCTLCHNELGRAPMLDTMVAALSSRLEDPGYQGQANDLESYLRESMLEPSAFVVGGFGKAGTNDTESPMPSVTSGSIGLGEAETNAVIAYLQDWGGADVTVEIAAPAEEEPSEETASSGGTPERTGYDSAEEIVAALSCGACHKIADQQGMLGPDLTTIGASKDREYLRRALLDPNADVAEGYMKGMMPPTYGDQLSANELEMLVDYMLGSG